jgi:hypothetical protein
MIARILLLLLIIPLAEAAVIGIFPVNETIDVRPFKSYKIEFYLFNPSSRDENVSVDLKCKNDVDYLYADVFPKTIIIPAKTDVANPKMVLVEIRKPIFAKPIFGEKEFSCRLYAKIQDATTLIVTAQIKGKLIGMNPLKLAAFLFLLSIAIAAIILSS